MPESTVPAVRAITFPDAHHPLESTAAHALGRRLGLPASPAGSPSAGTLHVGLSTASQALAPDALDPAEAWMWARIAEDGTGIATASSPALLYALVHLLADGLLHADALAEGLRIEPTFSFHRPHFDHVLTQVCRTARGFEPEPYVERLARSGFTHLEVNALAFPIPFEPGVATEYYNQFYTYCAGLSQFVDSTLTRGLYPDEYLQANLNRLKALAALGRKYGLQPGLLCFEPRTLPEAFFQRYPTLRGARVDHPFRSHHPRYTLAQDHPVSREHYRELMRNLMDEVPELSYLSVWTNDSGAGFEHTASLYVGRNGGPYLIREWREHEQIAETAGRSALRWLRLMQETAAAVNPAFEVLLRIEPFKVEHDTILAGMGEGLSIEAPSLLVRGYELPYHHPKYPEQVSAAGTLFHTAMDEAERALLEKHRARGFEPKLNYAVSSGFNMEPLLGIPFPRLLHAKLTALRETGFRAASAFGGLLHVEKTPYWPHPEVIRAVQFTPEVPVDDVLHRLAERWAGAEHASDLMRLWHAVEDAVAHLPIVPLYTTLGFVWYRLWIRPLIPDIEAIPAEERRYYERFLVSTANNPNINDLGRDVLFELIDQDAGLHMADAIDVHVLPRIEQALADLDTLLEPTTDEQARAVYVDLRDRTRALQCWVTTQRNTCAWVAGVYGFRDAETDDERTRWTHYLQQMIDLDLANTRRLLDLWETSTTEFMLVSDVGETSFIYGENLADLLRRKINLTEQYRDRDPYIDEGILWRLP